MTRRAGKAKSRATARAADAPGATSGPRGGGRRRDAAGGWLQRSFDGDPDPGRLAPKTGEALAAQIEQEIIGLGWPVGEVLGSEPELIDRYGVSRAVFREAVRLLEHQMVARMRSGPGGGLVVAEPDASSVTRAVALYLEYRRVQPMHLLETRIAIELKSVELATERIDEAGVARLRSIIEHERSVSDDAFAAHSHDLHVALAEITQDPVMELFVRVLTWLTGEHAYPSAARPEERDVEAHQVHARIVEAVVAGDRALAQRRMLRHLEAIGPWLQ